MNEKNKDTRPLLDKDGIPKVVTTKEFIGDACGMASTNCISQVCGNLSYFYTDKVGMAAATVSMVTMLATLSDGISDLIMGRIFDRSNSKEGKCRPWLKRMIIPTFLAIILLTLVPRANTVIQSIYATLTLVFARAVVYTAITIPYFALINYTTKSLEERGKLGNMRTVFNNAVGVIFGILLIPVTNALGGTQRAWVIFAAIVGIIGSLLLSVCYKCTHERYREETINSKKSEESEISALKSLNILIHNKYWIIMVIAQFFLFVVFVLQGASLPYYCKWILGNDNMASVVNMCAIPMIVAAFLVIPVLVKRTSLKVTGMVGIIMGILGTIIRIINPTDMKIFTLGYCLVIFATSSLSAVMLPMVVNTCEWNDYHYGYKLNGMTNSAASFGSKVGAAIGTAVMGMVLTAGGYNPAAKVQTASSINSICYISIHIIGICFIVMLICFIFYSFEKQYPEMMRANQQRREKGEQKND